MGQGGEPEKSVDGRVVLASALFHPSCRSTGILRWICCPDDAPKLRPLQPGLGASWGWGCCKPAGRGKHPHHHAVAAPGLAPCRERAPRNAHVPGSEQHSLRRPEERAVGYRCSIYRMPLKAKLLCLCITLQEIQDWVCCLQPCVHCLGWALGSSVTREQGGMWIPPQHRSLLPPGAAFSVGMVSPRRGLRILSPKPSGRSSAPFLPLTLPAAHPCWPISCHHQEHHAPLFTLGLCRTPGGSQ